MSINVEKIRRDFPIFNKKTNGKSLVFLDSASTSQKPKQVIDAVKNFYENYNANVHRSVYKISSDATEMYEGTREKLRRFIGADGYHIIFTKNCTEAINLVAGGWAEKNLKRGDSILSSVMEHHSNIVPWQKLGEKGVSMKVLDINEEGRLMMPGLKRDTKIVSLTHVSNVLGTINNVKEICKVSHENGSMFMIDGAQSVPHMKMNLKEIGADFVAFSGHKMLGPMGVGVLAVKKDVAEQMNPILFGSDMIREVTFEKTTFADAPIKFETGTPDVAGVIGLSAAVDYLSRVGMGDVERHENSLTKYAIGKLEEFPNLKLFGPRKNRSGVLSFNLGDAHPHDVATVVDDLGIAIRSGHHCAQPLMRRLGTTAVCRASFYLYNTKDEVDALVDGLEKTSEVLKI